MTPAEHERAAEDRQTLRQIHESSIRIEEKLDGLTTVIHGSGPHDPGIAHRVDKLETRQHQIIGAFYAAGILGGAIAWLHGIWPFSLFGK